MRQYLDDTAVSFEYDKDTHTLHLYGATPYPVGQTVQTFAQKPGAHTEIVFLNPKWTLDA